MGEVGGPLEQPEGCIPGRGEPFYSQKAWVAAELRLLQLEPVFLGLWREFEWVVAVRLAHMRSLGIAWREYGDFDVGMISRRWFHLRGCIDCTDYTVDGNLCLCELWLEPSALRDFHEEVSIHDVMGKFY